ncbi:peptide methionine sulfoxide reductase MsrA [Acidocella aquatica]|uniref:Peptide methionine sulfoxide reductase MsrA n=1 Tax=Acidocella aquatica TaxID=1922313 RepID=A0ABQ6A631_9PROT|nr:peptide-methionine (S)-S-oxide reductase MsrA [Acidocella aquatica]GLR65579.1 peptide methionine sulfoxide reductase MsrA [Acidocella aquatica]
MSGSRTSRHPWRLFPAFLAVGLAQAIAGAAFASPAVPPPAYDPPNPAGVETATLSGGCFWGMQGVFEHVRGVIHVYSGYTGGGAGTAQYETVSTGLTGHAESVQIIFNPKIISYGKILQIDFAVASDPTELNYQGPDSGTQYRSEIWYASPEQQKIASLYLDQLTKAHIFPAPIVVRLAPAMPFYQAEAYHQDFLVRHPHYPYIAINDIPKVRALQTTFPAFYQAVPVTVFPAN